MKHKQKMLKVYPVGNSNRVESIKLKVLGVAALLTFAFSFSSVTAHPPNGASLFDLCLT